jgi:hypothetical protein
MTYLILLFESVYFFYVLLMIYLVVHTEGSEH